MRAFIKFNQGVLKMPIQWLMWLALLVTVNLVIPLFYLSHLEAQVVAATMVASMVLMTILTGLSGFTRLLGLGHILWAPLLYFLWMRLDLNPANDFFGLWIRALMILNSLSLILDTMDVGRYIAGDRSETVASLSESS
jgi:hypothetical protein